MTCSACHRTISRHETAFQRQEGWAKLRAKGTNSLRLRSAFSEYLCLSCLEQRERGISAAQDGLFGDAA